MKKNALSGRPNAPTLTDVAREAGVGVATVDRVINRRSPVRPDTAQRVLAAAERLGFHRTALIRQRLAEPASRPRLGFLLQSRSSPFYRELGRELEGAAGATASGVGGVSAQVQVVYLDDLSPDRIAQALAELAQRCDAVALVAADHPRVSEAIDAVSARGVPVFALVSDLPTAALAGYVGIDHRTVGRSAAWTMARLCRQPGPVGLILGSHRYLCQEQCEASFRSYLREVAPEFRVLETQVSLESTALAEHATLELLHRHPDLVGIYVAGGGIEGVLQGLAQHRPTGFVVHPPMDSASHGLTADASPDKALSGSSGLVTVCHDLTEVTRQALRDGRATVVLSHPRDWIAARVVQDMLDALADGAPKGKVQTLLPFTTWTAANV